MVAWDQGWDGQRGTKEVNFSDFCWSIVDLQVMLISTLQQRESVIRTPISTLCFRFFSHLGHHSIEESSYATQQGLISYLFYTRQCVCVSTPTSQLVPHNHLLIVPIFLKGQKEMRKLEERCFLRSHTHKDKLESKSGRLTLKPPFFFFFFFKYS